MNLAYFKDRFNNTESDYLLARRANNPGLNPFARQAIEEIIAERGERLPAMVFENKVDSQSLKDSKVYKFWHFIHARTKVLAVNAVDAWRNRRFLQCCRSVLWFWLSRLVILLLRLKRFLRIRLHPGGICMA